MVLMEAMGERARTLRELPPELRNAGIAAAAMVVTLFLPWYEQSYVPEGSREFVQRNVSAFGAFSFVEAAVMLVAAGVLFLVWARSEKKGFHLPGGDGTAIALAGGWALLLIVWRLFDEPDAPNDEHRLLAPVGHLRRARRGRRAAGRWACACAPRTGPSRRTRRPTRARRRASRGRRAAAPIRPRSPRCSASGRTGRASRREAPGRARRAGDEAPTRRLPEDDEAPTRRLAEDDRLF